MRKAAPAELDRNVQRSLAHCRRVTHARARNFYYGLKLTAEPKRSALYAIYAFMRACDDLADDTDQSVTACNAQERIEVFREHMRQTLTNEDDHSLPQGLIWPALRYVTRTYPVNPAHLHTMLDGQKCDLEKNRYATFDELYHYCYKVASVVGLVCVSIWGHDGDDQVHTMAEHRGIALQLTNILRDLVEDARRDRVYLPNEDLHRFDLDEEGFLRLVLDGAADERFVRLMVYQLERFDRYYQCCQALDHHISRDSRATSWVVMRIYRGLFDKIKRHPRRVLSERVRLNRVVKLRLALRGKWIKP